MAQKKTDPLKIVSFSARNIKRIRAVEIIPDPADPIVVLTGKNRQGKTSIISSVWMALGGKDEIPSKPIREGEKEAVVTLDLGDFVVERRFTENNSYLSVKSANGFAAPKPQQFLSSRLGSRAQNPLEFLRLKPTEQVTALQSMINIDLKVADLEKVSGLDLKGVKFNDPIQLIDSCHTNIYEKRKTENAEVKRLEGTIESLKAKIPAGKQETRRVIIAELLEERKAMEALKSEKDYAAQVLKDIHGEKERSNIELGKLDAQMKDVLEKQVPGSLAGIAEAAENKRSEGVLLDAKIEETEKRLAQLKENRKAITEDVVRLEANYKGKEESEKLIAQLKLDAENMAARLAVLDLNYEKQLERVESIEEPDFTDIDTRMAAADDTNKVADAVEDLNAAQADMQVAKAKSQDLTARLDDIKEFKGKLIVEAGMPVPGLGFEMGEVTFNGVPLSQASTSEQIEISCAICAASHPEIGILTLDIGFSELDSESKQVLINWAAKTGTQIWCTQVRDEPGDDHSFFIEDGMVAAVNGVPVAAEIGDVEPEGESPFKESSEPVVSDPVPGSNDEIPF
jgi:hypothetical protein